MRRHYFSTYLLGTVAVMAMAMGQSCQAKQAPAPQKTPCEKKMNDDADQRRCPDEEANGEATIHVIEIESQESENMAGDQAEQFLGKGCLDQCKCAHRLIPADPRFAKNRWLS